MTNEGSFKLVKSQALTRIDRVLPESKTFRLNFTAKSSEAHKFFVEIEDNFGSILWEQTFESKSNDSGDNEDRGVIVNPINSDIITSVGH